MYCKWCGMDSKDDKRCEWCGRPFPAPNADEESAGDEPTTDVPPVTTAVPPAGDAAADTAKVAPPAGRGGAEPTAAVPPAGDAVPDATTAMPPADDDPAAALPFSPRMTGLKPIKIDVPQIAPFEVRIEKYLSVMTVLLAAGMAAAHYFPAAWVALYALLLFMSGLLMGSFRVAGYYENDDALDLGLVIAPCIVIGPPYAAVLYLLIGLAKREVNYSLLGLMASLLVIRLAIGSAAHGFYDTITYMATFKISYGMVEWATLLFPASVLVVGWVMSSFTRPLNE